MDFFATLGTEWLVALGSILLVNLILSGDNAVIIALASKNLPPDQRKQAVVWGGAGAVVLRILLTFAAAFLLDIPYLQFFGGLALLWIAISLISKGDDEVSCNTACSLKDAVKVILFADLIMSMDNVLALAAIAQTVPSGKYVLITLGLASSVPLVMFGAQMLMNLMTRFPVIIYFGAGILGYAASEMIVSDKAIGLWVHDYALVLHISLVLLVIITGYLKNNSRKPKEDMA